MRTLGWSLATVAVVAAVMGCSPKRVNTQDPEGLKREVLVNINNDFVPPRDFTIYLRGENGERATLGSVSPSSSTVLKYRPVGSHAQFRLVAHPTGSRDVLSQTFTFIDAEQVTWDMGQNVISVH